MAETRRKTEVVTQLLVDATRRQAHAKGRVRMLRGRAALLKRSAEGADAQAEYETAQGALDGLAALVVAVRVYRETLRSSVLDIRAVARFVSDQMQLSNPGVPEYPPSGEVPKSVAVTAPPGVAAPLPPAFAGGTVDMEDLLGS